MSNMTREQIIEQALKAQHVRSMVIERAEADGEEDSRTVELSFASDAPITHFSWSQWRWIDIQLSMDKKNVRTERLSNGAPLLADHNHRDQIGVIESFTLDAGEGKARAKVRFSRSARGEEIYRDVVDGIRKNVSVGFMIHKLVLKEERDKKKGEIDLYEATDWEPYECSIVAVPADISVGVGRSLDAEGRTDSDSTPVSDEKRDVISTSETNMSKENETPETPAVETPQRSAAITAAREIGEWGEVLGEQEAAREYLRTTDAPTVDGFKASLRAKQPAPAAVPQMRAAEQAARQGGVELARSIPRYGTLKAFRGKDADLAAYRSGKFLQAVLTRDAGAMQYCREHGIRIERMHSGNTNEAGGFLVPEEFENAMIDLRVEYGVFRRNANVVPMNSDTKSRPRRTGGLTAYPVGAGQTITESTKGWDRVNLTAKKWAVLAKWENELSDDSIINLADDLASEGAYALTNKEDECGFNGDGTGTYHNIVGVRSAIRAVDGTIGNIAGIQVASGNAYSEIVIGDLLGLIGKLPQYARRTGQNKFYCSNTVWANVLQRLALGVGGVTHAEVEGALRPQFFGYPVEITEVMPATAANDQLAILFGNLGQAAIFGDRKGVTVAMSDSDSTDFAEDQMAIRITERFDVAVHDVGTTSVGGAVVALAMAGA